MQNTSPQPHPPEVSEASADDIGIALDRTCHSDLDRGFRAGEVFKLLPRQAQDELRSVSGLVRYLNAHLDDFDLDTVVVFIPGDQGPQDGMISVFISQLDEPVDSLDAPSVPRPQAVRRIEGPQRNQGRVEEFRRNYGPPPQRAHSGKARAPRIYAGL